MTEDLEELMHEIAEAAVQDVHRRVWLNSTLTPAQSRLVWVTVIRGLLDSVWIDLKTQVIRNNIFETPDLGGEEPPEQPPKTTPKRHRS